MNGRLRQTALAAPLQKTFVPRLKLASGRYRIRVRVVFQLGSGTPASNLRTAIKICRQPHPRFTG